MSERKYLTQNEVALDDGHQREPERGPRPLPAADLGP